MITQQKRMMVVLHHCSTVGLITPATVSEHAYVSVKQYLTFIMKLVWEF